MKTNDDSPLLYSIILPTYNEKQNLPIMIELFEKYMGDKKYEVIVVDDNSLDGTAKVAKKLQQLLGDDKIKILLRAGKMGLGSAYMDGFQISSGDFVILMDCDLSHHPKYLPRFIERQINTNCDIVTGTRYNSNDLLGDSEISGVCGWDTKRRVISAGANTLIHMCLNVDVSDLTGSFRLYKRSIFKKLLMKMSSKGFSFQMEIMVLAKMAKLHVEEVPIIFFDRRYGESKIGSNEILRFLESLLLLMFKKYTPFKGNKFFL